MPHRALVVTVVQGIELGLFQLERAIIQTHHGIVRSISPAVFAADHAFGRNFSACHHESTGNWRRAGLAGSCRIDSILWRHCLSDGGERRIGPNRRARLGQRTADFSNLSEILVEAGLTDVNWSGHSRLARSMGTLGLNTSGAQTFTDNDLELVSSPHQILKTLAADIDSARMSVLMEFYIWHPGGDADNVLDALIQAAQKGVYCGYSRCTGRREVVEK